MRDQIVGAARRMRELGLVCHTVGNVSARAGRSVLITPTRVHPDDLSEESIVELVPGHTPAGGEPSLEWRLHVAIYRARPDIGAIVHTHSPYALARSFDPEPLEFITEERTYLGMERVHVCAPGQPGSRDLANAAAAALGARLAVLLGRHGVVGVGASPRDALEICCVVEHQAQVAHLLAQRSRMPFAP